MQPPEKFATGILASLQSGYALLAQGQDTGILTINPAEIPLIESETVFKQTRPPLTTLQLAFWLIVIGLAISPLFSPPQPITIPKPPKPDTTPTLFYVGTHIFKAPANDAALTSAKMREGGPFEIIFDLKYPGFDNHDDGPKSIFDITKHATDSSVLELIIMDERFTVDKNNVFHEPGLGMINDTGSPGPYGLITLVRGDYFGTIDTHSIELTCGDPAILGSDGTRDDECNGLFNYKDLLVQVDFSVRNLPMWKLILSGTMNFLSTHEQE